jgi:hypothetical protein
MTCEGCHWLEKSAYQPRSRALEGKFGSKFQHWNPLGNCPTNDSIAVELTSPILICISIPGARN